MNHVRLSPPTEPQRAARCLRVERSPRPDGARGTHASPDVRGDPIAPPMPRGPARAERRDIRPRTPRSGNCPRCRRDRASPPRGCGPRGPLVAPMRAGPGHIGLDPRRDPELHDRPRDDEDRRHDAPANLVGADVSRSPTFGDDRGQAEAGGKREERQRGQQEPRGLRVGQQRRTPAASAMPAASGTTSDGRRPRRARRSKSEDHEDAEPDQPERAGDRDVRMANRTDRRPVAEREVLAHVLEEGPSSRVAYASGRGERLPRRPEPCGHLDEPGRPAGEEAEDEMDGPRDRRPPHGDREQYRVRRSAPRRREDGRGPRPRRARRRPARRSGPDDPRADGRGPRSRRRRSGPSRGSA